MNLYAHPKRKIIFLRSVQTQFGGAEVFLSRLLAALKASQQNQLNQLNQKITSKLDSVDKAIVFGFETRHSHAPKFLPTWLKAWWFNFEARLRKKSDELYFSLDRIDSADIYRAGDGLHIAYLKTRDKNKLKLWLNPTHWTYLFLEKKCLKNAKIIICNAPKTAEEIKLYYPQIAHKISIIPNGLPKDFFEKNLEKKLKTESKKNLAEKFNISPDQTFILTIGSGFERKGVKAFLDTLAKLLDTPQPWTALIIGKEKKLKLYQQYAEKLGLAHKVIFTGLQKNIALFYQSADIFLTLPLYEPFGNVVLEAMAYECAVLTNPHTCGMGGFLPKAYQVTTSIEAMLKIKTWLENPDQLSEDQKILKNIALTMTLEKTIEKTLEIIKKY